MLNSEEMEDFIRKQDAREKVVLKRLTKSELRYFIKITKKNKEVEKKQFELEKKQQEISELLYNFGKKVTVSLENEKEICIDTETGFVYTFLDNE